MKLLDLLRKGKRKAVQEDLGPSKLESAPIQDPSSKKSTQKTDPVEKWLIRSRGSDGRLRHKATVESKPTIKGLSTYGPGEYSIQKVGRKFSKADRIVVTEASPKNETDEKIPPMQKPKSTYEPTAEAIWESLQKPETTPLSGTKRKAVSKSRGRRPSAGSSATRTKSNYPPVEKAIAPRKEQIAPKEVVHPRRRENQVLDSTDASTSRIARITPTGPENETKLDTPIDDMKPKSHVRSPEERGREDSYRPRSSESVAIEAKHPSGPEPRKEEHHKEPEPIMEKKSICCVRCGEHICDHDKIGLWKDDLKKCDFCGSYYCMPCYPEHRCPKSEVCSRCDLRFFKKMVFQAEYCRRIFCSQRCVDVCGRENKENPDCQGCGGREEELEENEESDVEEELEENEESDVEEELEENEESDVEEELDEDVLCPECDALMEEEDDTRVCPRCKGFFCSPYCFRRYHRSEGLRHKALTWEEFSDLPEEDERRTKVVIVRA